MTKTKTPPPAPKKRQIELSDTDIETLGRHQYSDVAWDLIGRRHGVDPTTRESIPNTNNRAFLAFPKLWPVAPKPTGGILTANGMKQSDPVHTRSELRRMTETNSDALTQPISDHTTTEEIEV